MARFEISSWPDLIRPFVPDEGSRNFSPAKMQLVSRAIGRTDSSHRISFVSRIRAHRAASGEKQKEMHHKTTESTEKHKIDVRDVGFLSDISVLSVALWCIISVDRHKSRPFP
jgi:hypothetical protein